MAKCRYWPQRDISLRYNDLSVFGAKRPCISHPPGPPFSVRTTFRNFTFCGYGLRERRPEITRNETRTVPADRPPDQLAFGHRLVVARPSALSALHGAGEQHRVDRLPGRLSQF